MKIKSTAVCAVKIGMPQFSFPIYIPLFPLLFVFISLILSLAELNLVAWSQCWLAKNGFFVFISCLHHCHIQTRTRTHASTHKNPHMNTNSSALSSINRTNDDCVDRMFGILFIFLKSASMNRPGQIFDSMEVLSIRINLKNRSENKTVTHKLSCKQCH